MRAIRSERDRLAEREFRRRGARTVWRQLRLVDVVAVGDRVHADVALPAGEVDEGRPSRVIVGML